MDDGFSVRWSGTVEPLYTEAYTFITSGDDGVRLWVNGELLIDDWNTHTLEEHEGTTSMVLQAGRQYAITLEYFEDIDTAAIWLEWKSAHQMREVIPTSQLSLPATASSGSGAGALGSYYSDTTLSTLVLTRTDSLIDFDWDVGSPDGSVPDDEFSVRWTATIVPLYTEPYTGSSGVAVDLKQGLPHKEGLKEFSLLLARISQESTLAFGSLMP